MKCVSIATSAGQDIVCQGFTEEGDMTCTVCGEPAVISRRYSDMCQSCWDSLCHEHMIMVNSVRDFGPHHKDNHGPNFFAVYYTGEHTLGCGIYVPREPREAMAEARRTATRNGWRLLRVDNQKTLIDIFVSEEYSKYMKHKLKPLPFDEVKYA